MIWALDKTRTRIPLDPDAPVFLITSQNTESGMMPVERAEKAVAMVDHNRVCPARKKTTAVRDRPDGPVTREDVDALRRKFS